MESKIILKEGTEELIIRNGAAAEIVPEKGIEFVGLIGSPSEFVKKRKGEITPNKCHAIFDIDDKSITIKDKEHREDLQYLIKGQMETSKEVKVFLESSWGKAAEMAKFLKKNKRFFVDQVFVNDLIKKLQKFNISVTKKVKETQEQGGTYEKALESVVNHNFDSLNSEMILPLHKGFPPKKIPVELWIDSKGSSVLFSFECFELEELMVAEVTETFKALRPDFEDYAVFEK